jgi:CheY-like chemotaxis protein
MPGLRLVPEGPPDAFVIDLERRPSDGREVGAWLRRLKATRHVPIVFAGGAPDKVARVRDLMPDAAFASWEDIVPAVERAVAQPPGHPLVVALSGAPDGFAARLEGATVRTSDRGCADFVVLFVREQAELERRLPAAIRSITDGGSLWIAWPKRASGISSDLTQVVVRRLGMDAGPVDYKVASFDETWSGLRFARRRAKGRTVRR